LGRQRQAAGGGEPSLISSTLNCRSARRYTCSALERRARHNIMLARSTACRHGLGRASTKATSISSSRPSRTSVISPT